MKMLSRLSKSLKELEPFQTQFAVVYEDMDMGRCAVMHPDPNAMAALMAGGVFPPVWVYWKLAKDEAQPDFKRHHRMHLLSDTPREGPKTEEEALLYLIMKDVPQHIWRNYETSNSVHLKIIRREQQPDREFRNAWRVAA
tara:strand:+ start:652 stop:1071 length:420 start_codon:yes stop_codon:yes gene_type:complete